MTSSEERSPLKSIRERRGMTRQALSLASGVSTKTIQRLEGGEQPRYQTVVALAKALGVTESDLSDDRDATIPAVLGEIQTRIDDLERTLVERLTRIEAAVSHLAEGSAADAAQAAEDLAAAAPHPQNVQGRGTA